MKGAKRGRKQAPRDARDARAVDQPVATPQPLKPRRGLFIILLLVLALWIVVLVSMYFLTIDGIR